MNQFSRTTIVPGVFLLALAPWSVFAESVSVERAAFEPRSGETIRGVIHASRIHIRAGDDVHVDDDLILISDEDIVIDGSLRALSRSGADGNRDGVNIRLITGAHGRVVVRGEVRAGDGLDGETPGRAGGRGGDVIVESPTLWMDSDVIAGRGGDGGPGARGGDGGWAVIPDGNAFLLDPERPVTLRGGRGGDGGDGLPGQDGGDGGDGGIASGGSCEPGSQPLGKDGADGSDGGADGSPPGNGGHGDHAQSPNEQENFDAPAGGCTQGQAGPSSATAKGGQGGFGGIGGPAIAPGINGGKGGNGGNGGHATSGNAGNGQNAGDCCEPSPDWGRPGGHGGAAGLASAGHGGDGGHGGIGYYDPAVGWYTSLGGDGGNGGKGGSACSGNGGNGGNGGDGVPAGVKGNGGGVLGAIAGQAGSGGNPGEWLAGGLQGQPGEAGTVIKKGEPGKDGVNGNKCPTGTPSDCENKCGGQSDSGCWCDEDCFEFGDCCADICLYCDSANCFALGACCFGGDCFPAVAGECLAIGGSPLGEGTDCDDVRCPGDSCMGDIIGNGVVGVPDLLALLSCWGPTSGDCAQADLDGDGVVGVSDLLVLLSNWGPCE